MTRLIDADKLNTRARGNNSQRTMWRNIKEIIDEAPTVEERPKGACETCKHRDPEDKKCDCGELERAGCLFPVRDDYFCKFYETNDIITVCRNTAIEKKLPLYLVYYEETGILDVYITETNELFEKRRCSKYMSGADFKEIVDYYLYQYYPSWKGGAEYAN